MSNKCTRIQFKIEILSIVALCFGLIFWTRIILIVNPSETAIAMAMPLSKQCQEENLNVCFFYKSGFYRPQYVVIGPEKLLVKGNWPWMSKLGGVLM